MLPEENVNEKGDFMGIKTSKADARVLPDVLINP